VGNLGMAEGYHMEDSAQAADMERAKACCFRLLAYRARSEAELGQRLRARGFAASVIEQTLARLRELGMVDDAEFAEAWVEGRLAQRPMGPAALRSELRRKGVPGDVAARAIEKRLGEEAQFDLALALAHKRLTGQQASDPKVLVRIRRSLVQRGFSSDIIQSVMARIRGDDD
jgi:regulatory protein